MTTEAKPKCATCGKVLTVDQVVLFYGKLYCLADVPVLRGRA